MTDHAITHRRRAIPLAGALLLCAAVAGAAAPAHAGAPVAPNAPLTVADWQAVVGSQIDAGLKPPLRGPNDRFPLTTVVEVALDRDGDLAGARMARGSGDGGFDRQVLRLARRIAYPPLPVGLRGRARTVMLQAYFGEAATPLEAARQEAAVRALASSRSAKHDGYRTAALPGD